MLNLADKLSKEKVDEILSRLLPNEKSARRRMNRLESFIFTKSQEERAWLENYLLANDTEVSEEELDSYGLSSSEKEEVYEGDFEPWDFEDDDTYDRADDKDEH